MPLLRMPPNGAASLSVSGSLIQKVPALISAIAFMAQVRLLVKTLAPRPYSERAARAMASSPSLTTWIEAMGPKTSSQWTA